MSTCKTCPFFDAQPATQAPKAINHSGVMGACRLKPPVTMLVGMQQTVGGQTPAFAAIWPSVTADEFCAEHPERRSVVLTELARAMRVAWDAPLKYDANRGEMNRTPTPEEMLAMAAGAGPIPVAVPRTTPTIAEPRE